MWVTRKLLQLPLFYYDVTVAPVPRYIDIIITVYDWRELIYLMLGVEETTVRLFHMKCFLNLWYQNIFNFTLVSTCASTYAFRHLLKYLSHQSYGKKLQSFSRMVGLFVLLPAAFDKAFENPTKWKCRALVQWDWQDPFSKFKSCYENPTKIEHIRNCVWFHGHQGRKPDIERV